MLRQYFMNGLMALAALGLVLTSYNALMTDKEDGHTATDHLASYLNLDVATSTKPEDETVVSSESTSESSTEAQPTETVEQPAVTTMDDSNTAEPTTQSTVEESASQVGDKAEVVYEVKEGDTYGCIAENYYGSFEHWPDVMAVNPSTEGYTEYELHVGAKIVLPAVSAANIKPASNLCN